LEINDRREDLLTEKKSSADDSYRDNPGFAKEVLRNDKDDEIEFNKDQNNADAAVYTKDVEIKSIKSSRIKT